MTSVLSRALARRFEPKTDSSKLVAILVPLSVRSELTPDEEVSMRHLRYYFGKYDKYLIAPEGLPVHIDGFQVKRFPRKFFGSAVAHNRLTYAPSFYKAFEDYKFIFFYHLDSLVFSDQLERWCQTDLDYVGAPWFVCDDTPWVTRSRVGNGGFTLLRVESAMRVLANRYLQEPSRCWLDFLDRNARVLQPVVDMAKKLKHYLPRTTLREKVANNWAAIERPTEYGRNNDLFWSDEAVRYLPEFKVATIEQGLQFAFEAAPRMCFELNKRQLPFGCHAWTRFDRAFWEPHLITNDSGSNGAAPVDRVMR